MRHLFLLPALLGMPALAAQPPQCSLPGPKPILIADQPAPQAVSAPAAAPPPPATDKAAAGQIPPAEKPAEAQLPGPYSVQRAK